MVFVAAQRVLGLRLGLVGIIVLAAAAGSIVLYVAATDPQPAPPPPPDALNGSGQYAPALLALAAFAGFAWWRNLPSRRLMSTATFLFLAALFFRSIDLRVCPFLPIGTHFLWHLLLGAMSGILLLAMRPAPRGAPA